MSKFSPGPWVVVEHGSWEISVEGEGTICRLDNRGKWFPVWGEPNTTAGRSQNRLIADARLIAAAPALLEALQTLLPENVPESLNRWVEACDKARAAIAAATNGESA